MTHTGVQNLGIRQRVHPESDLCVMLSTIQPPTLVA